MLRASVKDCLSAAYLFLTGLSKGACSFALCRSFIISMNVCFDAIKMLLTARCHSPFTKKNNFPPATLIISTLRIVKEHLQFNCKP